MEAGLGRDAPGAHEADDQEDLKSSHSCAGLVKVYFRKMQGVRVSWQPFSLTMTDYCGTSSSSRVRASLGCRRVSSRHFGRANCSGSSDPAWLTSSPLLLRPCLHAAWVVRLLRTPLLSGFPARQLTNGATEHTRGGRHASQYPVTACREACAKCLLGTTAEPGHGAARAALARRAHILAGRLPQHPGHFRREPGAAAGAARQHPHRFLRCVQC